MIYIELKENFKKKPKKISIIRKNIIIENSNSL